MIDFTGAPRFPEIRAVKLVVIKARTNSALLCCVCLSALCEDASSMSTAVGDEVVTPKSGDTRDKLQLSSSVASPHSPRSSDELGMSVLLLSSCWCPSGPSLGRDRTVSSVYNSLSLSLSEFL